MFMINGIVGLDAKEAEELQTASPHFTSNMYQLAHLRSLLEQDIEACKKRREEIAGKNLTGEYLCKEGEIWESLSDCLGARLSLDYCLDELDKLTGKNPLDDSDDKDALLNFMKHVKTEEAKTTQLT